MSIFTIESLSNQLNQLRQQHTAAANMTQQCAGAIGVVQQQLNELITAQKEEELAKAEAETNRLQEIEDGKANEQAESEAA
jgi:uncharacterized radical SAM superfamily Fe-S cluster-containing enzyme